jgi:hypothetical protein
LKGTLLNRGHGKVIAASLAERASGFGTIQADPAFAEYVAKRRRWMADIQHDKDPFTPAVMKELENE